MYTLYNRRKITAALAALALAGTTAGAQQAFNSLSFGVELGTTGVGVELAMPLVTDHMVFKLGFNAPSLSYGFSTTMPMDQVNATVDNINAQLQQLGLPEHIDTRMPDMELSLRPVLNLSTAKLMLEQHAHPGVLKDGVCSPGGTTIQGVRALEANGFRSAAMEAVIAAYDKTVAMGN